MGAIIVKKGDHHIVYKMKIDEMTLRDVARLLGITDPGQLSQLISGANAITVLKGPPSPSGSGTTSASSGSTSSSGRDTSS